MLHDQPLINTLRLQIRPILESDVGDLFEMDSDLEVHRFLEQSPLKEKNHQLEIIRMIQEQYRRLGIGRWAVVDRNTNECLGWAGLKKCLEPLNGYLEYYDLGYRLKRKHWGKGYATEACTTIIQYAFEENILNTIHGAVDLRNQASINVLEKLKFKFSNEFDLDGIQHGWYTLQKDQD